MEGTFKELYEHSMDAILLTSPDGGILAANPAAEETFGMSEEEIIKAGRQGLVDIADPRLSKLLEERERTGHIKGELTMIRRNGQKFPVEISSNVFKNEKDEIRTSMMIRDISERKAAEEQVKQLNQRLEGLLSIKTILANTILDSSLEAIVALDNNMRYIVYNKAAENISGLKRENVLGEKFQEVHPYYKGTPIESYYRDALGGKVFRMDSVAYMVPHTGREGYFDASYAPMRDERGAIVGMVGTFQESTERVKAEMNLKQSERKYRLLAERATDVIYLTSPDGRYTYASPSLKKVTGYETAEIIGHHFLEYIHPEDIDKVLTYLEEQKTSPKVAPTVYRRLRKDGNYRWMESVSQNIRNPKTGEIIEIQSTVRDIHDRVMLEEELRESERKFRLLAEHSTDIIYRTDRNGIILYASPSLEKITGFKPEHVVGHSFFEYIHPEDLQNVWAIREKHIAEEGTFMLTYRRVTKAGKYLWMESTSIGIRDEATGEVTEFQTSIRDVTERIELEVALKQNNEQLQHTISELEQFISILSHDFKEPLRMVSIFSKMFIASCSADSPDTKGYAARINEGIDRMRAMLEDLRDYQSVVQAENEFEEVDVSKILENVKEQLKTKIESNLAELVIGPMPTLYANRAQLCTLFHSLIDNSLKFRKKELNPRIEVSAEKKGDQWQFAVKDNGIGMKQEYENKIFIVFERLHAADRYPGTGMGLSIARKVVENHSGRIWLQSTEGIGTTFYFTLPAGHQH